MPSVLILTTGKPSRAFLVDRDKIDLKQILNSAYGRSATDRMTEKEKEDFILMALYQCAEIKRPGMRQFNITMGEYNFSVGEDSALYEAVRYIYYVKGGPKNG